MPDIMAGGGGPDLQSILSALQQGGAPNGNIPQTLLPILAGLGGQQSLASLMPPSTPFSPFAINSLGLPPPQGLPTANPMANVLRGRMGG